MMNQPNYAPGMRDSARQLRVTADRAVEVANYVDSRLASMTYAGPSADRFRAEMTQIRSIVLQSVNLTRQAADVLDRDAQQIESAAPGGFTTGGSLS